MAAIVPPNTGRYRLRQDQTEVHLPFEDDMPDEVHALIGHIGRQTASRNRWTFVMLSPSQNAEVVRYLRRHSKRPIVAMELWALCFEHLRNDTGEILLSREEIAEKLGQPADDISKIMSELVDFGAIIRKRQRVVGLKGPGMVHYFMNPKVATHREGQVRNKAQEDATLLLTLMEGGKAPKPA